VVGAAPAGAHVLSVVIDRIEQLGGASFLYCSLAGGGSLTVHAPGQVTYAVGTRIEVYLPVASSHLFPSDEGEAAFAQH